MNNREAHNHTLITTSPYDPEDIEWDPELMGWRPKPCSIDGHGQAAEVMEQPRASVVLPMEGKHEFEPLPRPSATAWRSRTVEAFKICCLDDLGHAQPNNIVPADAILASSMFERVSPSTYPLKVQPKQKDELRASKSLVSHNKEMDPARIKEDEPKKISLMTLPQEIRDMIFAYAFDEKYSTDHTTDIWDSALVQSPLTRRSHAFRLKNPGGYIDRVQLATGIRLRRILVSKRFFTEALLACHHHSTVVGMIPRKVFVDDTDLPKLSIPPFLVRTFKAALAKTASIWVPASRVGLLAIMVDSLYQSMPKLRQVVAVDDEPHGWHHWSHHSPCTRFVKTDVYGKYLERNAAKLLTYDDLYAIVERKKLPAEILQTSHFGLVFKYITWALHRFKPRASEAYKDVKNCDTRKMPPAIRLRWQVTLDCDIQDWVLMPDSSTDVVRKMMLLTLLIDVESEQLVNSRSQIGSEVEP